VLLDSAFQVPGTSMRFGMDPVIGLIPGAGDLITGFFSVMILLHALRLRVPKVIVGRMLLNIGTDLVVGAVPVLGDLFDAAFKANLKNMALLEAYGQPGATPRPSDYLLVGAALVLIVALMAVPLGILWWLLSRFAAV
jgi:ascorbate-specific PTS system EIIC-type component UlaA